MIRPAYMIRFTELDLLEWERRTGMSSEAIKEWFSNGQNSAPFYEAVLGHLYNYKRCKLNDKVCDRYMRDGRLVEARSISISGFDFDKSINRGGHRRKAKTAAELDEHLETITGGFAIADMTGLS